MISIISLLILTPTVSALSFGDVTNWIDNKIVKPISNWWNKVTTPPATAPDSDSPDPKPSPTPEPADTSRNRLDPADQGDIIGNKGTTILSDMIETKRRVVQNWRESDPVWYDVDIQSVEVDCRFCPIIDGQKRYIAGFSYDLIITLENQGNHPAEDVELIVESDFIDKFRIMDESFNFEEIVENVDIAQITIPLQKLPLCTATAGYNVNCPFGRGKLIDDILLDDTILNIKARLRDDFFKTDNKVVQKGTIKYEDCKRRLNYNTGKWEVVSCTQKTKEVPFPESTFGNEEEDDKIEYNKVIEKITPQLAGESGLELY